MEVQLYTNRHSVYNLSYHLILCTKYRHMCINETLFGVIREYAEKLFTTWGGGLLEINYEPDHVHMLIQLPPQTNVANLVGAFKSITSKQLKIRFPEYLKKYYWNDTFWSKSYLILSSGDAPIDVIKKYIQNQNN